jgi:hypothetical protein
MGMALDESTENLDKLESNGIIAFIDSRLNMQLSQFGDINIDYVTTPTGQSGYRIQVGSDNCKGCSCDDTSAH